MRILAVILFATFCFLCIDFSKGGPAPRTTGPQIQIDQLRHRVQELEAVAKTNVITGNNPRAAQIEKKLTILISDKTEKLQGRVDALNQVVTETIGSKSKESEQFIQFVEDLKILQERFTRLSKNLNPEELDRVLTSFNLMKEIKDRKTYKDSVDFRLGSYKRNITTIERTLAKQIDTIETALAKQIDGVETTLGKQIDGVDTATEKQIDSIASQANMINNWILGIVATVIFSAVSVATGLITIYRWANTHIKTYTNNLDAVRLEIETSLNDYTSKEISEKIMNDLLIKVDEKIEEAKSDIRLRRWTE
ncbi:hypothetical protein [Gimesia aquarii]|uniref:Uncharacterized protein n=1 Tax=Gimesia aquarii TaxID=2527964 RepID=A0A517WSD5_9PLAN|nr:hypothetical protein [Gimesia aquarii]QDU08160.1 hypothetical protein V202x_15240 [Gimesia aquarii]